MVVESRLLVSVDEAAHALGISRRKLQYLVDDGEIVSVHIGRAVRVPTEALRTYVEKLADQGLDGSAGR